MGRQSDRHKYPAGKKRFEPLGVLIFAVAMIASFAQVSWAESDGRPRLIPRCRSSSSRSKERLASKSKRLQNFHGLGWRTWYFLFRQAWSTLTDSMSQYHGSDYRYQRDRLGLVCAYTFYSGQGPCSRCRE